MANDDIRTRVAGFDLDEETIETFDSILLALTNNPELQEEFTKLKFIQVLKSEYDSSDGPIKQMIQKMAQIEQGQKQMLDEHTKAQMDMKRAVADMTAATKAIRQSSQAMTAVQKADVLKQLEGLELRQSSYTWNQN